MRPLRHSPRLAALAIGGALCLGLLAAGEVAQRARSPHGPRWEDRFECRVVDPLLGGGYEPNCRGRWERLRDGVVLWSVGFSTDELGRRRTIEPASPTDEGATLFFGCSYVAGAGVEDDGTLPSHFQRLAPGRAVYNYGGSGFGPQQMLATLRERHVAREIESSSARRTLVYTLLGFHVHRAIGSFIVYRWAKHFPYYREGDDGSLVRDGSFRTGRPLLSLAYELGHSSALARRLIVEHPRSITGDHVRLTARIINESAVAFRELFEGGDFHVLVYPGSNPALHGPILRLLDRDRIAVHDYSTLFDVRDPRLRVADGHPSALAHQIVATRLARDLGPAAPPSEPPTAAAASH